MSAEEIAEVFLEVIEGGKSVSEGAKIIQFVADNGATIAEGIIETAAAGNGVAAEVTAVTETVSGATATTGFGLLAVDVGVAGAAIAPALGIAAGVGLYNLAPEFWTNVSNKLVEAGQTIGGKVHGILTSAGIVGYSAETIEIFKQAFIDAGIYENPYSDPVDFYENYISSAYKDCSAFIGPLTCPEELIDVIYRETSSRWTDISRTQVSELVRYYIAQVNAEGYAANFCYVTGSAYTSTGGRFGINLMFMSTLSHFLRSYNSSGSVQAQSDSIIGPYSDTTFMPYNYANYQYKYSIIINGTEWRYASNYVTKDGQLWAIAPRDPSTLLFNGSVWIQCLKVFGKAMPTGVSAMTANILDVGINPNIQPNAIYPTADPFPQTYPEWEPLPTPQEMPQYYPVELPYTLPDQEAAQDPVSQPEVDPDPWVRWIIENLPIPDPNPDPYPEPGPTPEPDPDPQPDPEPVPEPDPEPTEPNPPDPNEPVEPDPVPFIPPVLDTVDSTKIFTVYNPTNVELDALGAYLWSNDVLETIVKIWQNPLDGVISLRQVYCTPVAGDSHNIILGSLDSGVSAAVVTSQFTTIDCGSVTIGEKNKNVTDYSPYATIHLYLPFIGIVQLDVDEVMNSTLNVKYTIDVYTGTCLAEVYVTRSPDMTVSKILYTFSGNCSQTLPLTASDATGLASTLASLGAAAIGIVAGGGALGAVAGASMVGHSLTHEMINIGHSGSLSSNAGIMGQRKPYVIIGRRHGYDANSYNEIYGYPTNKTVFLSNCTGYVRVKAINLQSAATEEEKKEITQLLKQGVIM